MPRRRSRRAVWRRRATRSTRERDGPGLRAVPRMTPSLRLGPAEYALAAGFGDRRFEPPRFRGQHRAPEIRQQVVTAALVILFGGRTIVRLDNQRLVEQALEQRVERSAAQPDQAVSPCLDLADDAVAVPRLVGQREQDLERERGQREERAWISHAQLCNLKIYLRSSDATPPPCRTSPAGRSSSTRARRS